jgi:hypothetical protein
MRLAIHINEYTEAEIDACYYSCEDFRAFKQDVKRTARMIEMKQKMDESVSCARGVESFTKNALKMKSNNRRAASLAVLKEQECQFEETGRICYDDAKIAAIYSDAVRESATLTGLADEICIMEQKNLEGGRSLPNIACNLLRLRTSNTPSLRVKRTD